ncbi:MAG TPA: methylmalonyl Co-A mutase-associated GTPase MeaB [Longilinea sp.]|nr:methylmalonyl Co-A mutase-associated GTPase MeaB [Longilinea sp.]
MSNVEAILQGDRRALAQLLTLVENDDRRGADALDQLFPHTGKAHLVGITGSPGTGKSSLANQLARVYRKPADGSTPRRVAVVAVDPSSPFTGGAILGDRVRMRDLSGDPGVFIRSMASRGALGGIARTTAAVVQVLDAAGYEMILIETVGAGQAEVDIARLAHTTIVVEAPGLGDDIQAIKAGILEIADILVVNKADLPGAENTLRALRASLELAHPVRHLDSLKAGHAGSMKSADALPAEDDLWLPPVLLTESPRAVGIVEVTLAIARHADYLHRSGEWEQREQNRLRAELDALIQAQLVARWRNSVPPSAYDTALESLYQHKLSPQQAARDLVKE